MNQATRTVPRRAAPKVLLVDDDVTFLDAVTRTLSATHHVSTASNIAQAIAACQINEPDVALVDVYIGSERGLDALRALHGLRPQMPIIMVSGRHTVANTAVFMRAGAYDILEKPADKPTLLDLLDRVQQGIEAEFVAKARTLDDVVRDHVLMTYDDSRGNVSETARRLDVNRQTASTMLIRFGARKPPAAAAKPKQPRSPSSKPRSADTRPKGKV